MSTDIKRRHKWDKNPIEKTATCRRCGFTVPLHKTRKGGLLPCPGLAGHLEASKDLKDMKNPCLVYPQFHRYALEVGIPFCWSCGNAYTPEELNNHHGPRKSSRIRGQIKPPSPK